MRSILFFVSMMLVLLKSGFTQPLDSTLICIDPGHGGHESDDREIVTTGFWESESNFEKGVYLKEILEDLGATVILTREGNDDNVLDDPSLSQRVEIANSNFVDYMHSIHSNGFQGESNYTLILFQGFDDGPTFPEAKEMAEFMGPEIFNAHRTTSNYIRGDFDFYGTGQPYLGIFRNLNMPGTLSEGSFHDYIPESWRLMNSRYRKHESWAIARSFLKYFEAENLSYGEIAGVVRDDQKIVDYYYISGTDDENVPINNVTATLQPGNQIYSGDELNNGFFLFDSLMPGTYSIHLQSPGYFDDSIAVVVQANKTVFADKYLQSFVPDVPANVRVFADGASSLKVQIDSSFLAIGYRVYMSEDGVTFTDTVDADTTEIIIPNLQENVVYYFKVSALSESGESAPTRHLYAGVPSANPHDVLIVNGFDRSTNNRYDYIRFCADPVNDRGYPFSYVLNETVIEGDLSLLDFATVIWILGDESTVDETFSNVEQELVKNYLDNGGHFFVSGPEIGWDLDNRGSSSDKQFYNTYLKADYISDAPDGSQGEYYTAVPITRGLFEGLESIVYDDGTHGTFDSDWPDAIWALGGAGNILQYQGLDPVISNGAAAIAYEGVFPGGTIPGKLVYLAFPFETIYNEIRRAEIMDRVFDFFEGEIPVLPVEDEKTTRMQSFNLQQNYPNPFNPLTQIKFSLSETNQTTLIIYDITGRIVKTLLNNKMASGEYKVDFNASNLASGTYFYILRSGPFSMKKKMVLLK